MIRDAIDLLAIGAFLAVLALWSGIGTETVKHHRMQASIAKVRS